MKLHEAPKLEPHTVLSPGMMSSVLLVGLAIFAPVYFKFGILVALLSTLFGVWQFLRLYKMFSSRLPPGYIAELRLWMAAPEVMPVGKETDPKPLIKP